MSFALLERTQQLFSKTLRIEGPSMEPTYLHGSEVRVNAFSYAWREPQRGDVVALRSPENEKRWDLKRVVGLPGDSITWNRDAVWVNEHYFPDLGTPGALAELSDDTHHLRLKAEEYFVLGDNRLLSRDSRAYGALPVRLIVGKITP